MAQSYLIKPILDKEYASIAYGEGIYLYDTNGNAYIDGSSGAVTASIGHGVQNIIQAMHRQAEKVSFVYRSQFTTEPAEDLALKIKTLAPGNLNWSFFVNSGSEATETAMKLAVQYWQEKGMPTKKTILSRKNSYHGMTIGALSMSGHPDRRARFEYMLAKYPAVSSPYEYRNCNDDEIDACDQFYIQEFEQAIQQIGPENIAAFIAEPLVGAAGAALMPTKNYYQKIKALCEANDILYIADEVMTGIARTGKMFAMEHFDVIPDMITTGKGMSAGYTPMAAVIISDDIIQPIKNGSNVILGGHTYSANPQSAATSLAVINYIEDNQLVAQSAQNGAYLLEQLLKVAANSNIIGDVRGLGLFVGIEFATDKTVKESFPKSLHMTDKVLQATFDEKLLVYPANTGKQDDAGDAIIIAPPLTITKEEIDILVERFKNAIQQVEQTLQKEGHA